MEGHTQHEPSFARGASQSLGGFDPPHAHSLVLALCLCALSLSVMTPQLYMNYKLSVLTRAHTQSQSPQFASRDRMLVFADRI